MKFAEWYVKNRNYTETELSYEFSDNIGKKFNSGLEQKRSFVSKIERNIKSIWTRRSLFSAAVLFSIKSKCITLIAQKTGIIHWFEIKNPPNTSQTDIKKLVRAFKREAVQFLVSKKPCRKSLTAGSPSCGSNVSCKLQTWPQGRGHVTFCGLRFSMKNLMLKVSNI